MPAPCPASATASSIAPRIDPSSTSLSRGRLPEVDRPAHEAKDDLPPEGPFQGSLPEAVPPFPIPHERVRVQDPFQSARAQRRKQPREEFRAQYARYQ